MTSVDLTKRYREHYRAGGDPVVVEVPERPYLMIDGEGDPNTAEAYQNALATLYPLAYGLRKEIKAATGVAYRVMPLEGLWWVEDVGQFSLENKSNWRWTVMVSQPDEVTPELAATVITTVSEKKNLPSGELVRLERFGDGLAVQLLHRGPYAEEAPTIERLHRFIEAEGYEFRGKHHEIYLSDPRRGDPANNRTIIRQPVVRRTDD